MDSYSCQLYPHTQEEGCSELIKIITDYRPFSDSVDDVLVKIKKVLAKNEALLNQPTKTGWTPLMVACRNSGLQETEKLVELLLSYQGIDVNLQTFDNECTALMMASQWSRTDSTERTVELLLNHPSINVNLVDSGWWTALMFASRDSRTDSTERTVELLLNHPGVDVNLQESDGWTALMLASRHSKTDSTERTESTERTVELLLNHPDVETDSINDVAVLKEILRIKDLMSQRKIEKLEKDIEALKDSPYPGENYLKSFIEEGFEFTEETIKFYLDGVKKQVEFVKQS